MDTSENYGILRISPVTFRAGDSASATLIIAHLDELGYFWYLFPIDFHRGYGMLKGRLWIMACGAGSGGLTELGQSPYVKGLRPLVEHFETVPSNSLPFKQLT